MELNEEMIEYLSELSHIHCTPEMKRKLLKDLQEILQYVETLNEVDTEGVLPACHVLELDNVMQDDEVGEVLPRKTFLDLSPDQVGGHVRVPTIIQKQEELS